MRWITTDIITIIKYWRYHYFVTPWEYFTPSEYIQMEGWEERGERSTSHLPPLILPPGCSNTFWPLDFQTICEDNFRNGMKMRPGIVTLYTLNYKSRQRLKTSVICIFFVLKWHFPNRKCREETELTKSYNLQCHISAINCQNNKEPAKFIQNMLN